MKPLNQIIITRIATVLQTLPSNIINGEPGIALVKADQMYKYGKELMEIVADEMGK